MKNLLLPLAICVGLTAGSVGCVEDLAYADPPVAYASGCVNFTDDYGTREVCGPYYYAGGDLFYWDAHFGCWIGPHGYWHSGLWHGGFVYGYHERYHAGFYHGSHGGGHAWGGFHGGGHSYHGGGGHGGHR